MKKIFFVAIAATLLAAGCQKTEVLNQVNPVDGTSMTFAPNMGKLTKVAAEATGEANLSDQDFRLWAYYKDDDPSRGEAAVANSIYDKMENIIVSDGPVGAATDKWNATTTHFWPGKGKFLKFYAISADEATYGTGEGPEVTDSKVSINPANNKMTVTNFIVNHNLPDTDLMVADYTEAKQKETDTETNTVNFTFRHALTKVEFLFRNSEPTMPVYVQQMYVDGINTIGTLTVSGTFGQKNSISWSAPTDGQLFKGDNATTGEQLVYTKADNYDTDWNKNVAITDNVYMTLTEEYERFTTWLVIPQDVYKAGEGENAKPTTDLKVTIAYVIKSGEEYRQFVSTFPLGTAANAVTAWDDNQYVKYNINLTPNIIGFDATVEPWEPIVPDKDDQGNVLPNDPDNDGQDVGINN